MIRGTAAILLCALALGGCGGSTTGLSLTVTAADSVNPNADGQPSPTVVRFYDLKAADTFRTATFFDIYDDDAKKLGADMLARREIEIRPGQTMTVKAEAPNGTLYLGAIAGFRDLDGAQWRDVYTLDTGGDNRINVTLQARTMTVARRPSGLLGF